jgi:hypothetical protein
LFFLHKNNRTAVEFEASSVAIGTSPQSAMDSGIAFRV